MCVCVCVCVCARACGGGGGGAGREWKILRGEEIEYNDLSEAESVTHVGLMPSNQGHSGA